MIALTLAEIAQATGGEVYDAQPGLVVDGPAFLDSRSPEPGGLFVAVTGEQVDGHDFAAGAVQGGAAAVLGSRPTGVPSVVVPDSQAALAALARLVLGRLPEARVVGITGSQGKTGTKDLLAGVLAAHGPTIATAGNFNNEWGVPLTVLRADVGTRHLVVEMGARGIGHIAHLCTIAPPHVGVVLNVGVAHIGEFGGRDGIARAKGELVEALADDGVAVLNVDDERVAAMAARTSAHVLGFGYGEAADVRIDGCELDDLGRARFDLVHDGQRAGVHLMGIGLHQAANAAAAAAAALALGLPLDAVADGLSRARASAHWRMELAERPDGLVLINDAYNANPDSMRAALETLAAIGERSGRRTVAVLGAMRELGGSTAAEHAAVGRLAHGLGIDEVVVVGPDAQAIHEEVRTARGDDATTRCLDDAGQAVDWLQHHLSGTDLVLVKASRSERLERVVAGLLGPTEETRATRERGEGP